jgi:E3 ubiquitin-protein ligase TRIP12
LRQHIK